jgi:hypothetical protein
MLVKSLVLALGGWAVVATTPSLAGAQAVWDCTIGQRVVVDARGTSGLIVAAFGDECLIKYDGGRTRGWVPWQALRAEAPGKPAAPPAALVIRPSGNPRSGALPPASGADAAAATAAPRPRVVGSVTMGRPRY